MKKFFRRILAFLNNLFTNLDEWIHEHVQPSIETVQTIKDLINSPVADMIAKLIPGDADDKWRDRINVILLKALDVVNAGGEIINQPTLEAKLEQLAKHIQSISPSMQKGTWQRIASEMAVASNGGKDQVKGHSVDLLTQLQFTKLAENANEDDLANVNEEGEEMVEMNRSPKVYNPATFQYE